MESVTSIELVAGVADLHVNDTKALCPAVFKREKGAEYRPDSAILSIWIAWKEFWQIIADKRAELEKQLTEELLQSSHWMNRKKAIHRAQELLKVRKFFNGDLCDMNKHSKAQLISPLKVDVQRALVTVAQPALDISGDNFVIRGTEAHTGPNGELEEWFAQDIEAVKCHYDDSFSWWFLPATWGGVKFDIAHHGPTGTKLGNKKNQSVGRAAEYVANSYARAGRERDRPDIAIFGHRHYRGVGSELGVKCRYLPPWKLVGAFGYRIGVTLPEPVGGWWCVCRDGKIIQEPYDDGHSGPFEIWEPPRIERWEQES